MPWDDLAALIALGLFFLAILLCACQALRWASKCAWVGLFLAAISGTMGLWAAAVFAAIQLWRELYPQPNLQRGLIFIGVMLLVLFRVLPGIGGVVIQLPAAPAYPLHISWASVFVAYAVYSRMTFLNEHKLHLKLSWWIRLSLAVGMGLLAAAVTASFRWTGPLDIPSSARWLILWGVVDLFFISISDESLFRGSITGLVNKLMGNGTRGQLTGLLLAALLYGLQRNVVAGDPFAGSALVGGLFGLTYFFSGSLNMAIFAHFTCDLALLLLGWMAASPRF